MKTLRSALLALVTLSGFAAAAELPPLDLFRDKEVVETFASIPVQESGRIKPLENVASYRLLRFRARRSIWLTDNGEMDGGKPLVDPQIDLGAQRIFRALPFQPVHVDGVWNAALAQVLA